MINSTCSRENYSKRIWNNTSQLAKELKKEMLVSLLTGRTDKETARVFEYKMGAGAFNARRLIRTESCYVSNEMERQAYDECKIKTYIYVATLDMRTSTICAGLDGKRFPVKDMQVGVNAPPMHPWCRSTTICDISNEELVKLERRAKNPETGITEKIPANMTYVQWHKKYVKGNAKSEYKKKSVKGYHTDKEQYERYKKIIGDKISDSIEKFQEVKYNNAKEYGKLKYEYKVVNSYEFNSGSMSTDKIVELDKIGYEAKQNFTREARKKANTAIMEFDGEFKIGNSQINNETDLYYLSFKGNKQQLVLKREEPVFVTQIIGSHNRDIDAEAKLLELASKIADDEKEHVVNLLSEKPMCESYYSVMKQFKQKYPNVHINVVSYKRERAINAKNKNMIWEKRK